MAKTFFFTFYLLCSPFLVYRVVGKSMLPYFKEGDKVLVWRWKFLCRFMKKDIVVLFDPRNDRLIMKRIAKIAKREFFVLGDNQRCSTDSRIFGWVAQKQIIGKVIYPRIV